MSISEIRFYLCECDICHKLAKQPNKQFPVGWIVVGDTANSYDVCTDEDCTIRAYDVIRQIYKVDKEDENKIRSFPDE